jgi:hypothetical protein
VMSVFALATAPNTCRPPLVASRLPTRTRGDVTLFAAADERRTPLAVITADAVVGWSEVTVPCGPPVRNVWLRSGSGLRPASMGSRCCRTPEARCQDLVTQQDIVRAQMKWPARIVRMMRPAYADGDANMMEETTRRLATMKGMAKPLHSASGGG